ncbi:MAG: hypothetical protein J6W24_06150 [Prevotella sp.]|nr:hypothetical protein [Prevotella sp.]
MRIHFVGFGIVTIAAIVAIVCTLYIIKKPLIGGWVALIELHVWSIPSE